MYDKVEIQVGAGKGGSGAISFRREKFVPLGGPDGGDGGDGGDVIVRADRSVSSLRLFKPGKWYRAAPGGNGMSKKRYGKGGEDLVLSVPMGTVVLEKGLSGDEVVEDLAEPGQTVVVARGGRGGQGNVHFASSTNQTPRLAQQGEEGEERALVLEMRLIADVGIIGYPNAGKSTLLAAASAARPKVADYPFTTLQPVLGVVEVGQRTFVMAEIPGLIEGAHLGRGLGHDFLRHITRTRMVIHLIDGASAQPVADMRSVNDELGLFDAALTRQPQVVAVNKVDLPRVRERVGELEEAFAQAGVAVRFISAMTGEGVDGLMQEAARRLERAPDAAGPGRETGKKVFRPRPVDAGPRVHREGGRFVLESPGLERLLARTGRDDPEVRRQLQRQLERLGVNRELQKAGARPGDRVRCGDFEWEW